MFSVINKLAWYLGGRGGPNMDEKLNRENTSKSFHLKDRKWNGMIYFYPLLNGAVSVSDSVSIFTNKDTEQHC